jgi:hypothetical protein
VGARQTVGVWVGFQQLGRGFLCNPRCLVVGRKLPRILAGLHKEACILGLFGGWLRGQIIGEFLNHTVAVSQTSQKVMLWFMQTTFQGRHVTKLGKDICTCRLKASGKLEICITNAMQPQKLSLSFPETYNFEIASSNSRILSRYASFSLLISS